jgi:ferritin-like metal-binding protein YciE
MVTKPEQHVLDRLNDASAGEQAIIQTIRDQLDDATRMPMGHLRIQRHPQQTKRHGASVRGLIEGLSGSSTCCRR